MLHLILCFKDYPPEDTSVSDPLNKASFRFIADDSARDKKAKPGRNFDSYLDSFMSRCGFVADVKCVACHSVLTDAPELQDFADVTTGHRSHRSLVCSH